MVSVRFIIASRISIVCLPVIKHIDRRSLRGYALYSPVGKVSLTGVIFTASGRHGHLQCRHILADAIRSIHVSGYRILTAPDSFLRYLGQIPCQIYSHFTAVRQSSIDLLWQHLQQCILCQRVILAGSRHADFPDAVILLQDAVFIDPRPVGYHRCIIRFICPGFICCIPSCRCSA